MGLDMYLYKKTYVQNLKHMKEGELHRVSVKRGGKERSDIKPERIIYITEQVLYWRKFYALHKWFVDNCQDGKDDCKDSYVSLEKLKLLRNTLNAAMIAPAEFAGDILPTQEGFFFGDTKYSEYYFESIKEVITLIDELLIEGGDFCYHSSW